MAIIITIVLVSIVAAMWLILTPVLIEIDSSKDEYRLSYGYFFSGKFLMNDYDPIVQLAYPFGSKDISLTEQVARKLKKETDKPKKINKKEKKKRGLSLSFKYHKELPAIAFRFISSLISKIKVKLLHLNIDTRDIAINGMLHALQALNGRNVNLDINYLDQREVRLRIEIVPASFIPPVAKLVFESRKFLRLKISSK